MEPSPLATPTGLRFADGIFQWDPVADAHGYIVEVASTNVSGSTRRIDAERAPLTPRPADGVGARLIAPKVIQFVCIRAVRFKPLPEGANAAMTQAIIEEGPPADPAKFVLPAVFVAPTATATNLRVKEHLTEAARDLPQYFHRVGIEWDAVEHAHGYLVTWGEHKVSAGFFSSSNPDPKETLRAYEEGEEPKQLPAALEGLVIPEDLRPLVHFSTRAVLRIPAGIYTQWFLTDAKRGPKLMYKVQPVTFLPPVEPGTPATVCKGALPVNASPAFSTLSDPLELCIQAADAKAYSDSSETVSALYRYQVSEKGKIAAELTSTKTALMQVQAELDNFGARLAASAAEKDRLVEAAKDLQATLSEHEHQLQDAERAAAGLSSALARANAAEAQVAVLRAELASSRTTEATAVADLVSSRAAASRETSRHEEAERVSAAEAALTRAAAAKDREERAEAEAACRAAVAAQAAAETAAAARLERVESLEAELARREAELKGAAAAVLEQRARVAQLEQDRDAPRTPSAEQQDAARLAQAYMAERDEARTKLVIEQQIHQGVIAALKGNLDAAEARSKRHAEDSAAVSASLVAANEAVAQSALARESLEAQVAEAQRTLASLEATLAEANARADANQSAAKAASEDLAKLQHAAVQTGRDCDTVSVQAESMLQALREQLAKVEEKWAEASKGQSKWRNEVLFMEGRISRAHTELEDVRAAYNESSARLRAEHAGLQQLYESHVGDVEELDRIIKAFRCPCLGHGGSAAFARPSEFALLVRDHAAAVRAAAEAAAVAPATFPLSTKAAATEKSTAPAFPSAHEFPPAAAPAPFDFASVAVPAGVTDTHQLPIPTPSAVGPPPFAPPRFTTSRSRSGLLSTLSPPPAAATPAHVLATRAFKMRLPEEKVALAETIFGNCNAMGLHPSVDLCIKTARAHDSVLSAMMVIVNYLLGRQNAVAAAAPVAGASVE